MWLWMLEIFDFHSDSPNSHVVMDTWNIWFPFWQPKRSCGYGCLKYLISILTTQEVMWLWMLEIFDFHSDNPSGHVVMDTWNIWFPFWQPKRSCGYGYLKYLISILTTQEVMWLWMLEIFDFHSDNPRGHVVMDIWNICVALSYIIMVRKISNCNFTLSGLKFNHSMHAYANTLKCHVTNIARAKGFSSHLNVGNLLWCVSIVYFKTSIIFLPIIA